MRASAALRLTIGVMQLVDRTSLRRLRSVAAVVVVTMLFAVAVPAARATSSADVGHRNGRIAFVAVQQMSDAALVSISPKGGRARTLFSAIPASSPVVSPDGGRLAFVLGGVVEVVGEDGSRLLVIGPGGSPTWSPDGSRLAFVSAGEIEVASVGGGRVRDLGASGSEPVWSPKGDWIAFFSGSRTLELIHPDGTGRAVLAADAYSDAETMPIAWSYDGAWLSFGSVAADTNVLELTVVRPDGSGRRSLGNGGPPAWSPRTDLFAFESNDNGFEIAAPDGAVRFSLESVYGTPVWSPNGKAVAVGSNDIPGVSIIDAETGAVSRVSIGGVPAWSPDASRLAAARGSLLRVATASGGRVHVLAQGAYAPLLWLGNGRIAYAVQARVRTVVESAHYGSGARVLLHGPIGFVNGPSIDFNGLAWAPDGGALAYLYGSDLRLVRSSGSSSRLLARKVTDTPTWAPDGRALAFVAGGLRVVSAAGGPSRLLTRLADWSPVWSPDGRRIAFLSGDDPYALYVVDRDGQHLRQLADGVSSAPSWSPDGKRIAFSVGDDYGPTAIETIRYDGKALTELASATADDTGDVLSVPRWSPDGKRILYYDDEYFCGSKCDELHLMLMRADGSNKHRLPGYLDNARWSPDGNELLGQADDESLVIFNLRTGQGHFFAAPSEAWDWQPLPTK